MSQKFLDWLLQEVFDRAHDPELGRIRLPALTSVLLENLEDAGILTTPQTAYFKYERGNIAAEVHGYACDVEDDVISLFYCIDATADTPLSQPATMCNTGKDLLDKAFRRLEAFVRYSQSDRKPDSEESQPAHDLIDLVKEAASGRLGIELHVLTTGVVSDRAAAAGADGSMRREIWDLVRLERICGGSRDGAITIDFPVEFKTTLPCLVTPPSSDGLRVLLTCIPGSVLADIYNLYRTELLERNVRIVSSVYGKGQQGNPLHYSQRAASFLALQQWLVSNRS